MHISYLINLFYFCSLFDLACLHIFFRWSIFYISNVLNLVIKKKLKSCCEASRITIYFVLSDVLYFALKKVK